MLLSSCAVSGTKKLTFMKVKNSTILIILKWIKSWTIFFLTGDKRMLELHLKHPGVTYSACGPFTKHPERIQKLRETGSLKHLCRNESDKAWFAHYLAYSDSKDLSKKTISDKAYKR